MYKTAEELPNKVYFKPIALQIDPTNACNLRCIMCFRQHMKKDIKYLSLNELNKIISQFPFLLRVHLQGAGEPLLNKKFFDMLAFLKQKVIVSFTTNATLISDEILKKIKDSGVFLIDVSVDGATKKTFENIRKGSDFQVFKKNLKKLILLRKHGIRVSANVVILKQNISELTKIIEILHELSGVDEMTFIDYLDNYDINTPSLPYSVLDTEEKENQLKEVRTLAEKLGINIEFLRSCNSETRYLAYGLGFLVILIPMVLWFLVVQF